MPNETKQKKLAINLIWLNRKLDPKQELIFREDWSNTKNLEDTPRDNYGQLLESAFAWCQTASKAEVAIWYDSMVTTPEQVLRTQLKINEHEKNHLQYSTPHLKDIRSLPIVMQNPDIFSPDMGLFFRIDLLKLIVTHHALAINQLDHSIMADIGIKAMTEEQLLNAQYLPILALHGILTGGHENGFLQAMGTKEVIKSLALIINANLQRCWQGLHCYDNKLRKYLLDHLFRAVYFDTANTLHFFSYGFTNGIIFIKENEEWVEYKPDFHGHLALGNYYQRNGSYNCFKKLESDFSDVESFKKSFWNDNDSINRFMHKGLLTVYSKDTALHFDDSEITLNEFLSGIAVHRGCRYDVACWGRDHNDPISNDLHTTEKSLALLPYLTILNPNCVLPIHTEPKSQLFEKQDMAPWDEINQSAIPLPSQLGLFACTRESTTLDHEYPAPGPK